MSKAEFISLQRCDLNDDAGVYICQGIQPPNRDQTGGIRTLLLKCNRISDEGAKTFADQL